MLTTPRFSLTTLGLVRLDGPSGELLSGRRKEIALLAYLARNSAAAVSREKLAALLWGDRDETKARQSLRHALHQLRRALGEAVDVSNGSIRIIPGTVELDALMFERGVAEGRCADALMLWHGDFLSGLDDLGYDELRGWLEREREGLRRLLPAAFENVIAAAREEQRLEDELHWAQKWTQCCPLDAGANALLVDSLLRRGEAGEARIAHAAFQARVRIELDMGPSAESQRLGEEIDRALRSSHERRPLSAALFTPDMIGRDVVLANLLSLCAQSSRDPAVALIEGEEGLGKSRLCAELARRTRSAAKGNLVLETRAVPGDSHAPVSTIRRVICALAESSAIEDAPNRALVELSRIAPELRRRFPQLAVSVDDLDQTETALRSAFRAIASGRPTLLIVDDFAYADSASQGILLSLARAVPPGMVIVFTVRPDQSARADILSEIGRLPSAQRIRLSPLSPPEMALLVDSMLQLSREDRETVVGRLSVDTGGNPFYALELVSGLADAGMLTLNERGAWSIARGFSSQALPLSPGLRGAIKLRLDQLSEPARKALNAAAAARPPIEPVPVQRMSGLSVEEFQPAIEELLSRRLLRLPFDGRPGYEFPHDLIRRVAAETTNGTSVPQAGSKAFAIRRILRKSSVQIGGILAIAAAAVFLFNRSIGIGPDLPSAPGNDLKIVVAAFANETGETQFDRLGRITADFLTRGIAQTGLISVLPPVVDVSSRGAPGASMLPDEFPRLSRQITPSMIISGAVYRSGDSLRFDAQITDTRKGRVSRVIDPVFVSAAEPMRGIEILRNKLLAALAPSLDVRVAASDQVQSHTPSYEAYKAFADGLDAMYGHTADPPPKFLEAYLLDPGFTLPLLYAAMEYEGQGQFAKSDSLVRLVRHQRANLPSYDRYLFDYQAAVLRGDKNTAYVAARDAAAIAPGSFAAVVLAPRAAIAMNYPAEAIRLLLQIDREGSAAKGLPAYWNLLAHSYHLLGRYEEQLTVARELRRRIPGDTRALYYEARAMAALGRLDELDAVLSESLSLPSVATFGPPGLGVHRFAAEELRAHGHPEFSARILERGVRFYRETAPAEVLAIPRFQHEIAYALYQLGRLSEARRIYEHLVVTKALDGVELVSITYYLSFIAAKQADNARVHELERILRQYPTPYTHGVDAFSQARLASIRGEKALTMRFLQQAAAEGRSFDHTIHHLFEFESMRGYKPFEAWLAPKG